MASDKVLRVLARGGIMVCNHAALDAGARRFIGRQFDESKGPNGGWPASLEPTLLPAEGLYGREYCKAVKDNELWPADQATADICKVVFDPNFGGEFTPSAAVKE